MAKFTIKNAFVSIGGVDLSDHLESVVLNYESEEQDITSMQDLTRIMEGGVLNWSMDLNFRQDFASGSVDATIFPLVGTKPTVIVRADAGAVSTTNPNYTGVGLISSYSPFNDAVGSTANAPVRISSAGALNRATS